MNEITNPRPEVEISSHKSDAKMTATKFNQYDYEATVGVITKKIELQSRQ